MQVRNNNTDRKIPKRYILRILFIMVIIPYLYSCSDDDSIFEIPGNGNTPIVNADFEQNIDFNDANSKWKTEIWKPNSAVYNWVEGEGINQSNCIYLSSETTENDIAIVQEIELEGDKVYKLTAWVKTENVVGGRGANICLFGTWISSEPLLGTHNWQKISVVFISPEPGQVKIACRLGFWGGAASGKAWFDNIQVEEAEMFHQQSEHFQLRIKNEDAEAVQPSTITNWLANLDKAYDKYYELIGEYPFEGNPITIFSVDTYPGGWAVAGNPILWHQIYVRPTLLDIENLGDWSFGIMHEIGHDFASHIGFDYPNNWNWDEEFFANFRMYYVVEKLNASVKQDKIYTGSDLKNYYKTYATNCYDNTIRVGNSEKAGDGVMYTFIRIKDVIGWEPFKNTYQYLYHNETNFTSSWQKFNFFLDKLNEYSGEEVRLTYPEGELETIKKAMDEKDAK